MTTHYYGPGIDGSPCGKTYAEVMSDGGFDSYPECDVCRGVARMAIALAEYNRHVNRMKDILRQPPGFPSAEEVGPGCRSLSSLEEHAEALIGELLYGVKNG